MTDMNELLINLETRIAYQEDTIEQLNEVIVRQDQAIRQLEKGFQALCTQFSELKLGLADENPLIENKPPHY